MTAPRLEIRLDRVQDNTRLLVDGLAGAGVGVTGVTKALLGSPDVARAMLAGGAVRLGDSRVENLEALRAAGIDAPTTLIRSPMLSQVDRVVACADVSLNSERAVLDALSAAAARRGRDHGVVLMVELGDLREGVPPQDLVPLARHAAALPRLIVRGIGTNLACQSGVVPDATNMAQLTALTAGVEAAVGHGLDLITGGNSANLGWALGSGPAGRVNDLRLGESVLLGRDPLDRRPLPGLHLDAFTLVAEIIEVQTKASLPTGRLAQGAFGAAPAATPRGDRPRVIVAIGEQDTDPAGLLAPAGYRILGASSDHLVLDPGPNHPTVGAELRFSVGYSALLRAATSPFVARVVSRS